MNSALLGIVTGVVVLGLLVAGGAGTMAARRRKQLQTTASPAGGASEPQPGPALHRTAPQLPNHVAIRDHAFYPAHIQIAAGTTISWTNGDEVQHTVTFRNGMADSGLLDFGQTFRHTFTSPGTFEYYCTVHPNMVGTVTVTSA